MSTTCTQVIANSSTLTAPEQTPSSSRFVNARSQSGTESAIGWVGGILIGAVLATVTLFIVCATVWMIRRKQQSRHKLDEQDQR